MDDIDIKVGVRQDTNIDIKVVCPGIPPKGLRGNSRLHYMAKSSIAKEQRELGAQAGLKAIAVNSGSMLFDISLPIRPQSISIIATCRRAIDGDNLLIGYKPFIDGLSDAGLITDDRHIKHWKIEIRAGEPQTEIHLKNYLFHSIGMG